LKAKLTAFDGHKLHICGKAVIPCKHNDIDHQYLIEFEKTGLGLPTTAKINLVHHVDTLDAADTQHFSGKVFDHYKSV